MESLGTMVSFFSQKVREKTELIRQLSLRRSSESKSAASSGLQTPAAFGLKTGVRPDVPVFTVSELPSDTVTEITSCTGVSICSVHGGGGASGGNGQLLPPNRLRLPDAAAAASLAALAEADAGGFV